MNKKKWISGKIIKLNLSFKPNWEKYCYFIHIYRVTLYDHSCYYLHGTIRYYCKSRSVNGFYSV